MVNKIDEISEQKKFLFLLKFTKELIKNSKTDEVFRLEAILKGRENKEKREIIQKIKEWEKPEGAVSLPYSSEIKGNINIQKQFQTLKQPAKITGPRILTIPEPKLPQRLQYLKPVPTSIQIDFGKLNPLVRDPGVRSIECNGPDEKITVVVNAGKKATSVILTKDEIDEIIKKFSEQAKIPIGEGVFRVAVGGLILSAIISDIIGSKFIIRRINYPQGSR